MQVTTVHLILVAGEVVYFFSAQDSVFRRCLNIVIVWNWETVKMLEEALQYHQTDIY